MVKQRLNDEEKQLLLSVLNKARKICVENDQRKEAGADKSVPIIDSVIRKVVKELW